MSDILDNPSVDAGTEDFADPQTEEPTEHEQDHPDPEPGAKDSDPADQKPAQDAEMNAKFAEMRRKMEAAEKAADIAKKSADETVARAYGHMGITTVEQLNKHLEDEKWRDHGVDPDVVKEIIDKEINNHPSVVAAREREKQAFQAQQMEQLNSTYGLDIKSVEDIYRLPNAEAMVQKILAGYDWDDAYLATHRDHVTQRLTAQAKQAALNNQHSKAHLKTPSGGADIDTFTVPDDVMAGYRRMFAKELRTGKMKEQDFIAHYRKHNKK